MVKNLLLDLDDTLLDFKRAEAIAIRDAFVELGIEPSDENVALYSKINRSCWAKLELGEYTRDEVLHKRFDMLFSRLGIKGNSHEAQKIYEVNLSRGAFYLPGARELLEELLGKYRLYLATNGIAMAENFFSILKTECIHRVKLKTYEEARLLIGEYIRFYNNERIQTKTKLTPLEKRSQYVA